MEEFRQGYAASRVYGVALMLEDATNAEELGFAISHLYTVYSEVTKAAEKAGLWRCD